MSEVYLIICFCSEQASVFSRDIKKDVGILIRDIVGDSSETDGSISVEYVFSLKSLDENWYFSSNKMYLLFLQFSNQCYPNGLQCKGAAQDN
eukprot:snap_masked-scaffold_4-processed-gene-0.32-mRNA-1 protein AED:1.00 eAED:1.00 QI:0/0/0/0/1/1/2/0/91